MMVTIIFVEFLCIGFSMFKSHKYSESSC